MSFLEDPDYQLPPDADRSRRTPSPILLRSLCHHHGPCHEGHGLEFHSRISPSPNRSIHRRKHRRRLSRLADETHEISVDGISRNNLAMETTDARKDAAAEVVRKQQRVVKMSEETISTTKRVSRRSAKTSDYSSQSSDGDQTPPSGQPARISARRDSPRLRAFDGNKWITSPRTGYTYVNSPTYRETWTPNKEVPMPNMARMPIHAFGDIAYRQTVMKESRRHLNFSSEDFSDNEDEYFIRRSTRSLSSVLSRVFYPVSVFFSFLFWLVSTTFRKVVYEIPAWITTMDTYLLVKEDGYQSPAQRVVQFTKDTFLYVYKSVASAVLWLFSSVRDVFSRLFTVREAKAEIRGAKTNDETDSETIDTSSVVRTASLWTIIREYFKGIRAVDVRENNEDLLTDDESNEEVQEESEEIHEESDAVMMKRRTRTQTRKSFSFTRIVEKSSTVYGMFYDSFGPKFLLRSEQAGVGRRRRKKRVVRRNVTEGGIHEITEDEEDSDNEIIFEPQVEASFRDANLEEGLSEDSSIISKVFSTAAFCVALPFVLTWRLLSILYESVRSAWSAEEEENLSFAAKWIPYWSKLHEPTKRLEIHDNPHDGEFETEVSVILEDPSASSFTVKIIDGFISAVITTGKLVLGALFTGLYFIVKPLNVAREKIVGVPKLVTEREKNTVQSSEEADNQENEVEERALNNDTEKEEESYLFRIMSNLFFFRHQSKNVNENGGVEASLYDRACQSTAGRFTTQGIMLLAGIIFFFLSLLLHPFALLLSHLRAFFSSESLRRWMPTKRRKRRRRYGPPTRRSLRLQGLPAETFDDHEKESLCSRMFFGAFPFLVIDDDLDSHDGSISDDESIVEEQDDSPIASSFIGRGIGKLSSLILLPITLPLQAISWMTSRSTHKTKREKLIEYGSPTRRSARLQGLPAEQFEEEHETGFCSWLFGFLGTLVPGRTESVDDDEEENEFHEASLQREAVIMKNYPGNMTDNEPEDDDSSHSPLWLIPLLLLLLIGAMYLNPSLASSSANTLAAVPDYASHAICQIASTAHRYLIALPNEWITPKVSAALKIIHGQWLAAKSTAYSGWLLVRNTTTESFPKLQHVVETVESTGLFILSKSIEFGSYVYHGVLQTLSFLFNSVWNILSVAFTFIAQCISSFSNAAKDGLMVCIDVVVIYLKAGWNILLTWLAYPLNAYRPTKEYIVTSSQAFGESFTSGFSSIKDRVVVSMNSVSTSMSAFVSSTPSKIGAAAAKCIYFIKDSTCTVFGYIWREILGALNILSDFFIAIWSWLVGTGSTISSSIWTMSSEGVKESSAHIKTGLSSIGNTISVVGSKVSSGINTGVSDMSGSVGSSVSQAASEVSQFVDQTFSGLSASGSSILDSLRAFLWVCLSWSTWVLLLPFHLLSSTFIAFFNILAASFTFLANGMSAFFVRKVEIQPNQAGLDYDELVERILKSSRFQDMIEGIARDKAEEETAKLTPSIERQIEANFADVTNKLEDDLRMREEKNKLTEEKLLEIRSSLESHIKSAAEESLRNHQVFLDGQNGDVQQQEALMDELKGKLETLAAKSASMEQKISDQAKIPISVDLADLKRRIEILEKEHVQLKDSLTSCCKNATFYQVAVEDHIMNLLQTLVSTNGTNLSEDEPLGKLSNWMNTYFVARNEIEEKLTVLSEQLKRDISQDSALGAKTAYEEEAQFTAQSIMTNVAEQIKSEYVRKSNDTSSSSAMLAMGLTRDEVAQIVHDALIRYDADKTGMFDYALETAGGSVVSTRCTETYIRKTALYYLFGIPLWYPSNTPRTAIQPGVHPGECWAFKGTEGYMLVQLSSPIRPTKFSMEHIPKSMSPTGEIDSAPRDFVVLGLRKENDPEPFELGRYHYSDERDPLQIFEVQNDSKDAFLYIELDILSNHGNLNYTCLYRFRVHGVPA